MDLNLRKEIHPDFDSLQKIFTLRKGTNNELPAFIKMCQTGKCPLFDYDRGFICVFGFVTNTNEDGKHCFRLWFQTVDDGDYGGWSKPMSFEKAYDTLFKIADNVFLNMIALPNTDGLNYLLRPYGIFVGFE
jgi:hypothetical protein